MRFYKKFTFLDVKNYEMITSKNTRQGPKWWCKKNLDDSFYVQIIPSLLPEISTRWDFLNRLTSYNLVWAWISCDFKSKRTNTCIWIKYGHTPKPYFTCTIILNCVYFKTSKTTFRMIRQCND